MSDVLSAVWTILLGLFLFWLYRGRKNKYAVPHWPVNAPPAAPDPPPAVVEAPKAPAPPARDVVTIRFVTAGGRALGSMTIDRKHRRPTMQYRPKNGKLCSFVCASSDGRTFVYRKVSEDRE